MIMLEYQTVITEYAAVAQSVAHLIGSEEVTGPIPVSSSLKKSRVYGTFSFAPGKYLEVFTYQKYYAHLLAFTFNTW